MNNQRSAERFKISDFLKERNLSKDKMSVEINIKGGSITGKARDLSIQGIGFEIAPCEEDILGKLKEEDSLFIKIIFNDLVVLVNAKMAWAAAVKEKDLMKIKCGVSFNIISPEDASKLSKIIDIIRKK